MDNLIVKCVRRCLAVVVAAAIFASCGKDDAPWLSLGPGAILVKTPGGTGTLGFTASDIMSVSVTDIPEGWTLTADMATMTLTAQAPAKIGDGEGAESGTATVIGRAPDGVAVTQELFVSVADAVDLGSVQSNCFIVSQPNTNYTFDAMTKGESGGPIATHDVRIVWQTETELIRYCEFANGKYSFYVGAEDGGVKEGNVLVGAYDAAGALLWTWHIWIVDADDVGEQTYANGKTFMSLNLGALGNTNATNDEILASFGLFYQWGRRVPFVGPASYDAARGTDHAMYDADGIRVTIEYVRSDAGTGTADYASSHPLSFILGVEESAYDWLYAAHSDELWGRTKTENDPCPKGWRVPSAEDFAGLEIVDKAAGTEAMYGWTLTDGTATAFYPAAGFRTYLTGGIQNLYSPETGVEVPKPWMGYYWTSGTDALDASAMTFWFDASDAARSGFEPSSPYHRAGGMQIRCVKE